MYRIIHISDFHLRNSNLFSTKSQIIEPLISDLKKFHSKKCVDLVICSGDLINKGGKDFDDIHQAFKTFDSTVASKIIDELGIGRNQFIITCGNHDIDRTLDSKIIEQGMFTSLDSKSAVQEYLSEEVEDGLKRINPYNEFVKSFYSEFDEIYIDKLTKIFKYDNQGINYGVASFNSSWRCYDSELDSGRLLIGEKQINTALEYLQDVEIKIAVTHHPLSYLREFDRDSVKTTLFREFDLIFMGHNHEAKSETTHSLSRGLFFSYAPGVMDFNLDNESRKFSNGYRIVDLNPIEETVESYSRRYNVNENRFDPNTDDGNANGFCEYKLPTNRELANIQKKEELAQTILEIHSEKFNSQLLSYNTDTIAPKRLSDLFVTPELVDRKKGESEKDYKETNYTIKDLILSDKNYLISGIKESGKTCLLNKIVEELSSDIITYNQVPVRIDFRVLDKRRIKSEINEFLKVGMQNIESLKDDHDILLIVDNINFDDQNRIALNKLKRFVKDNPSIRLIGTNTVANQEEIPLSVLNHDDVFEFRFLTLKNFKTKQIRSLVKNWFKDSEDLDTPDKVDNIVKLFTSLSLPRTPLAISILLWIIEKQEDYKPTNESTMLENFVERIFKKHSGSEVYSAKFDYANKTRILSDLAVHMLDSDKENYSLKYSTCLLSFESYLEERLFEFDAKRILDYFLEIGVLVDDNSHVRFRFQCFFEYFLMKQMSFEDSFRDRVLDENNYLQFANEIKYYTGIKRDQGDILKLLLTRLEKVFEPIRNELESNKESIDEYFTLKDSLLDQVDESTFLNRMESSKPTEDDLDQMSDRQLDITNPDSGIKKKELPANLIGSLGKILNLCAQVLKNSEEVTEPGLKIKAYQKIIQSEVFYTVLYQFELKKFLDENLEDMPLDLQNAIGFLSNYTPTILQLSLYSNIGTEKLSYVFKSELEECLDNNSVSDLKKFFLVFIYAESRGPNYPDMIGSLIKNVRARYIQDNILLKLVTYFYLRADKSSYEQKFLNIIADLIISSKGLPKSQKGKIINDYKKKKLISDNSEEVSQMVLDV